MSTTEDHPIVDMSRATPGDDAWTYRPDPTGEYGWVSDLAWFDDCMDPITVTAQRWRLIEEKTMTFYPTVTLCPQCGGDEEIDGDVCPTCQGSGSHPAAGEWVEGDPGDDGLVAP